MAVKSSETVWEENWAFLLHFLPKGWQDAAWEQHAMMRRRVIQSAEALLRLIFAYAWNDWSLRTVASWAERTGLGNLSDVAVLKRLRHAEAWLGHLVDRWFVERGLNTPRTFPFRLVLTDSTTIQEPGSPGTTWRLHAQWNLAEKRWEGLDLTDQHGGESLTRLHLQRNDVVLSDRNYAKAQPLAWIVAQKAHVIARFGWNALRWETWEGERWNVLEAVRTLTDTTPGQWWVQIRPTRQGPPLRLRVVALRKSPAAAAASRRQARQTARRHGHTVSAATLEAADYVLILTTLPETAWVRDRHSGSVPLALANRVCFQAPQKSPSSGPLARIRSQTGTNLPLSRSLGSPFRRCVPESGRVFFSLWISPPPRYPAPFGVIPN